MKSCQKQSLKKVCIRCVLFLTTVTMVVASPLGGGEEEIHLLQEAESFRTRQTDSDYASTYSQQTEVSQEDKDLAESFLRHYGYFRKGKPLAMLDDPESGKDAIRPEREAKPDAIRTFQNYFGLRPTGRLDAATLRLMKKDRCGVEDIPADEEGDEQKPSAFSVMRDKWKKDTLTWKLSRPTGQLRHDKQKSVIKEALNTWARVAPLNFLETPHARAENVDFDMLFGARNHGDKYPFDGPSQILAHAYGPIYSGSIKGDVHFDDDENWTTDNEGDGPDLLIVTTHELGHSLGLKHSSDPNALMYPYYGASNTLGQDDILAIQYLYGARIDPQPTTVSPPRTPQPYTPRPYTQRPYTQRPYTQRPYTTPATTTPSRAGCRADFDVVIKDVHTERDVFTGIRGDQLFRFTEQGLRTINHLHEIYPGAPVKADAVFTKPDKRATYFIKDNEVWRYTDFIIDAGYPRKLDPTHFPETVRFVLTYYNGYGQTERVFVFGSTWFWEYDFDQEVTPKPYLFQISKYWRDVQQNVKYVIRWTDNNMYFISPDRHVVLTRMRSQVNRGQEEGHPQWLKAVCQQVASDEEQTSTSAAAAVKIVSNLHVPVVLVLTFLLRSW